MSTMPTFPQPLLRLLKNQTGQIVCYKSGHFNLLVAYLRTQAKTALGSTIHPVNENGMADHSVRGSVTKPGIHVVDLEEGSL